MKIEEMVAQFKQDRKIYDSTLVKFIGVEGFDVYNCSIPFEMDGKRYIYGRVERRNEWARSWARLFEEIGKDTFQLVPDTMIYQLEDPYITFINGELVMGGTHVRYDGGNIGDYRGYFYRGNDLHDLRFFTSGPEFMKDIRLVQFGDKIGVFSRPDGKVGFAIIDDLSQLTSAVIANAPLLPVIEEDEYGGCNQCYALKDGYIGIIGHRLILRVNGGYMSTWHMCWNWRQCVLWRKRSLAHVIVIRMWTISNVIPVSRI